MSTNTTTIQHGSVRSHRGAIQALLAALLLAGAGMVAINAGRPNASTSVAPASAAEIEKALIDVRAGERDARGVAVPTAEFWADFRAAKREMR